MIDGSKRISDLSRDAIGLLAGVSRSPQLDAELIISFVTGFSRPQIIGFPERILSVEQVKRCEELFERRKRGEPVAYLVGKKEFYGRDFEVNSDVLVPRPETELIVERVISYLSVEKGAARILDLGTGSGCLAISIASWFKEVGRPCSVSAVDQSAEALEVAQRNASRLGVGNLISFVLSDWFAALNKDDVFDVIVANPPYIPIDQPDLDLSLSYEPHSALFSGNDGLNEIRRFFPEVRRHLAPYGIFLCEIGYNQGQQVSNIWIQNNGASSDVHRVLVDLAGLDRIFIAGSRFARI